MSRMLYKRGGDTKIHGVDCETCVVDTPEEEESARAAGFGTYGEMIAGEAPAEVAQTSDSAKVQSLRSDLQAAAELLEEERQARQTVETERDQANETIADMRA